MKMTDMNGDTIHPGDYVWYQAGVEILIYFVVRKYPFGNGPYLEFPEKDGHDMEGYASDCWYNEADSERARKFTKQEEHELVLHNAMMKHLDQKDRIPFTKKIRELSD